MDTFADDLWNPNKLFRPSRTSIETHEIDVYPRCEGENGVAYFEGVPATFNVEWEDADPDAGFPKATAKAEFVSFKVGSIAITRGILCQMLSRAEVEEIERQVSERITEGRS